MLVCNRNANYFAGSRDLILLFTISWMPNKGQVLFNLPRKERTLRATLQEITVWGVNRKV